MRKRIFIISFILAIVLSASLINVSLASSYNPETVFDFADLLTDSEEKQLREFSKEYEKYDISIIFMTTDDAEGKTTQNYSNDFYDNNEFRPDGIMFSIDMDNREIYIDTVGKCIAMISDTKVSDALDASYTYAGDGEYAACLTKMSKMICKVVDAKENPFQTAVKPSGLTIIVALLVTGIVVAVLFLKHNKANKKIAASHYDGNTFTVLDRNTVYMGCRKEVIPNYYKESESSSGGSSSHRSSGGISHGGGGHKF